jgi:nitrous oxide reductase accessory protein NosL
MTQTAVINNAMCAPCQQINDSAHTLIIIIIIIAAQCSMQNGCVQKVPGPKRTQQLWG